MGLYVCKNLLWGLAEMSKDECADWGEKPLFCKGFIYQIPICFGSLSFYAPYHAVY